MTSKRSLRSVVLLVLTFTMLTFSWTAFAADSDLGQDVNFIDVQKAFVGIEASQIPNEFEIVVKTNTGATYKKTKSDATITNVNGNTYLQWRIENLAAGTYWISEENYTIDGYTASNPANDFEVEIKPAEITLGEISDAPANFVLTEDNIWLGILTGKVGKGTVIISMSSMNTSERIALEALLGRATQNFNKPYYFFSIEEQTNAGTGDYTFYIGGSNNNGDAVTYDPDKGTISFGSNSLTNNKEYTTTLSYSGSGGSDNADIEITNTYTPWRLLVSKTVEGNLGSKNKAFEYTVKLPEMAGKTVSCNLYADETLTTPIRTSSITLDENGATTFTLSHGQTAVFDAIWGDYTVAETPVGEYEITHSINNGVIKESATANGTIAAGDNRVDFTNVLRVSPPTGIHDSVGAAGLMLMLAAAMLAILRIGGERRRYE